MPLVKIVRQGSVTLPAEARKALRLKVGDYLEAEVVDGENPPEARFGDRPQDGVAADP